MRLPIEPPFSNLSSHAITPTLRSIKDGYFDAAMSIRKRPGLFPHIDLTTIDAKYTGYAIQGDFWFSDISAFIVCCAGDVLKISTKFPDTSTTVIGVGVLDPITPVTFDVCADSANNNIPTLFMANGGPVVYTTGTSVSTLSGTNIPVRVTHVACVNGYLITNDLDAPTLWKHSDALTPLTWAVGYSYGAQSKTDNIKGLFAAKGRLYVFGVNSIEPFYDSGYIIPFVRIDGGVIEPGCVTPYAYCRLGSDIFYFNSEREIVYLASGSYAPVVVSTPYASRLRELSTINDVYAEGVISSNGKKYVLFSFNDAKTTIVFDPEQNAFYEWGYWRPEENIYQHFKGRFFAYSPEWNFSLFGDRSEPIVYLLSDEQFFDNTAPVRHELTTGIYDFGDISRWKKLKSLYLNFDRGEGLSSNPDNASAKAYLEWNIDFTGWQQPIEVDLGVAGSTGLLDVLVQGIQFRTIQFRILQQDECNFSLNGIYLDYE